MVSLDSLYLVEVKRSYAKGLPCGLPKSPSRRRPVIVSLVIGSGAWFCAAFDGVSDGNKRVKFRFGGNRYLWRRRN